MRLEAETSVAGRRALAGTEPVMIAPPHIVWLQYVSLLTELASLSLGSRLGGGSKRVRCFRPVAWASTSAFLYIGI